MYECTEFVLMHIINYCKIVDLIRTFSCNILRTVKCGMHIIRLRRVHVKGTIVCEPAEYL